MLACCPVTWHRGFLGRRARQRRGELLWISCGREFMRKRWVRVVCCCWAIKLYNSSLLPSSGVPVWRGSTVVLLLLIAHFHPPPRYTYWLSSSSKQQVPRPRPSPRQCRGVRYPWEPGQCSHYPPTPGRGILFSSWPGRGAPATCHCFARCGAQCGGV